MKPSPIEFPRISPAGDSAILIEIGAGIDLALNRRVHMLARLLALDPPDGAGEPVPSYTSVLLHYDPLRLDYVGAVDWARTCLARGASGELPAPRRVEIPTVYGGEFGPDLDFVAANCGLTPDEVVRIHTATDYPVYLMGFTPGFPYLGGMDARIAAPRLPSPRTDVPAGSVGIAGEQTGVYPLESPGGWRIIGRTPLRLFQPERTPPALLSAGDVVRFIPISPEEYACAADRS